MQSGSNGENIVKALKRLREGLAVSLLERVIVLNSSLPTGSMSNDGRIFIMHA